MKESPANRPPGGTSAAPGGTVPFGAADIAAGEKAGRVRALFEDVAARYDLMNDLMSLGAHRLWKAAAVDWLMPEPGMAVLDVAGGTGDMALRIAARMGDGAAIAAGGGGITVIDASPAMMEVGHRRAARAGLRRVIGFAVGDAEALPVADGGTDAYVIAFGLRNVTRPERALAEACRVLRPGGRFLCLEFSRPRWPLIAPVYARYRELALPGLGRAVAGNPGAYRYLAESIDRFPDQDRLAAMIAAAGLGEIRVRDLSGGIAAIHSAWRI